MWKTGVAALQESFKVHSTGPSQHAAARMKVHAVINLTRFFLSISNHP
jgi:hypothetical protein